MTCPKPRNKSVSLLNHLQSSSSPPSWECIIFPSLGNVCRNITSSYQLSGGKITDHLYLAKRDAVANAQSGFLAGFVCLAIKALQQIHESLALLAFH